PVRVDHADRQPQDRWLARLHGLAGRVERHHGAARLEPAGLAQCVRSPRNAGDLPTWRSPAPRLDDDSPAGMIRGASGSQPGQVFDIVGSGKLTAALGAAAMTSPLLAVALR